MTLAKWNLLFMFLLHIGRCVSQGYLKFFELLFSHIILSSSCEQVALTLGGAVYDVFVLKRNVFDVAWTLSWKFLCEDAGDPRYKTLFMKFQRNTHVKNEIISRRSEKQKEMSLRYLHTWDMCWFLRKK